MSEVWQPSRWTRQQMEERRIAALPMLSDTTLSSKTIAQRLGVSAGTVRTWRQCLRQGDTLEATFSSGRPSFLTDHQVADILQF